MGLRLEPMKVKELKELLEDADDDLEVYIPARMEFDGFFYSPSVNESGVCIFGDYSEEELAERRLLNKDLGEKDVFLLLPGGFAVDDEKSRFNLN